MIRHFDSIEFTFPLDGVMLTDAAGEKTEEGLKITAWVDAPSGRELYINGQKMLVHMHDTYKLDTVLTSYKNTLTLEDRTTGFTKSIDVYYLKKGCRKYRFSLDDNIWFLQNINEKKMQPNGGNIS